MLSKRIDEEAKFLAAGAWSSKINDLHSYLKSKGISKDEALIMLEALREIANPSEKIPEEFIEEIKKQIISKMLKKDNN